LPPRDCLAICQESQTVSPPPPSLFLFFSTCPFPLFSWSCDPCDVKNPSGPPPHPPFFYSLPPPLPVSLSAFRVIIYGTFTLGVHHMKNHFFLLAHCRHPTPPRAHFLLASSHFAKKTFASLLQFPSHRDSLPFLTSRGTLTTLTSASSSQFFSSQTPPTQLKQLAGTVPTPSVCIFLGWTAQK